ncbi:RadC family protein [Lyticum sinuosum]|uniref:RadC-like JAB domain-containing protein n=1 Tax=Lyticum sinuosum TaxID=1332059 RepID=A0AAE4VJW2_9RICK|nr:DNA repair protein RadC [Lyticum sinuosum]MDZ5761112.1 putative RadC-like JAB domain-containing protein [Lyticum sinuosum]
MHNKDNDISILEHKGHRERLKERFRKSKGKGFSDYEILELALFYVIARRDTKILSKLLLKRFNSLSGVFFAERSELSTVNGIGEATIDYLHLIADIVIRVCLPIETEKINILSDWVTVLRYCQLTMGSKTREVFRVLFLNKKNTLIADEFFDIGTVDRITIYPREIARYSLIHGAIAIIMVHNHPSGDSSPSKEDVIMTQKVVDALASINVVVHDHIIVSKNSHFSFRSANLI